MGRALQFWSLIQLMQSTVIQSIILILSTLRHNLLAAIQINLHLKNYDCYDRKTLTTFYTFVKPNMTDFSKIMCLSEN